MRTLALGSFGEMSFPSDEKARALLPSAAEMAALDKQTIDAGTSSLALMERAGTAVARIVEALVPSSERIVVLCGPGNNGGDGVVIARLLAADGYRVTAIVAHADSYSRDMQRQLELYPDTVVFGAAAEGISLAELDGLLGEAAIVIDALLGTGARAQPRGNVEALVRAVQRVSPRRIVAVDIPTGLDPDTGFLHDTHIKAAVTIAIEYAKRGMCQFPGRSACGAIRIASIGIGSALPVRWSAVTPLTLPTFSPREPSAHKGNLGHVYIIGGSRGMSGAAILASLGSLSTGAGLVTRVAASSWPVLSHAPVECITRFVLGEYESFGERDAEQLFEGDVAATTVADSFVLGPGLSVTSDATRFFLRALDYLLEAGRPMVLDADALTIAARELKGRRVPFSGAPVVITPHPGEAARLLDCSVEDVQRDRFSAAQSLATTYGCVALLKGAGTLIDSGEYGRVIARGTPYLATAGSGDVLSGIIGAILARGVNPFDAATLGAYLHAWAGERVVKMKGGPILASEIAEALPALVGRLEHRDS